jgi:hypothetical protein
LALFRQHPGTAFDPRPGCVCWLDREAYHIIASEASPQIALHMAIRKKLQWCRTAQLESAIIHLLFFARLFIM